MKADGRSPVHHLVLVTVLPYPFVCEFSLYLITPIPENGCFHLSGSDNRCNWSNSYTSLCNFYVGGDIVVPASRCALWC